MSKNRKNEDARSKVEITKCKDGTYDVKYYFTEDTTEEDLLALADFVNDTMNGRSIFEKKP